MLQPLGPQHLIFNTNRRSGASAPGMNCSVFKIDMESKRKLPATDILALDRTRLANERTFLAYFRTFIVLLSSGLAVIKLDVLSDIKWIGWALVVIGPAMLLIGIIRFFYVKRHLKKVFNYEL
nr:DUF202 domain-containing protein [Robertkochia sediminum]